MPWAAEGPEPEVPLPPLPLSTSTCEYLGSLGCLPLCEAPNAACCKCDTDTVLPPRKRLFSFSCVLSFLNLRNQRHLGWCGWLFNAWKAKYVTTDFNAEQSPKENKGWRRCTSEQGTAIQTSVTDLNLKGLSWNWADLIFSKIWEQTVATAYSKTTKWLLKTLEEAVISLARQSPAPVQATSTVNKHQRHKLRLRSVQLEAETARERLNVQTAAKGNNGTAPSVKVNVLWKEASTQPQNMSTCKAIWETQVMGTSYSKRTDRKPCSLD